MNQQTEKSPKKVYELVIEAVARYFQMTPEELKTGKSTKRIDVYPRHICYYLIRENEPLLAREFIAELFETGKSTIAYGEQCIDNQKGIYGRTLGDINSIQKLINNFSNEIKQEILQSSQYGMDNRTAR